MYALGDTVDLQLGTDAKADEKRDKAVLGDLRLSIGNLQGQPTAVVYRPVAAAGDRAPRKFFSGLVRDGYEMQSVKVLPDARIQVKLDRGGYTVEAAIALAALGLVPAKGLKLRGDLGATFGDPAGRDTILRSHWNNQATGLVADEVYELMHEPKNWGVILFE
jgi:hypothetical protein